MRRALSVWEEKLPGKKDMWKEGEGPWNNLRLSTVLSSLAVSWQCQELGRQQLSRQSQGPPCLSLMPFLNHSTVLALQRLTPKFTALAWLCILFSQKLSHTLS